MAQQKEKTKYGKTTLSKYLTAPERKEYNITYGQARLDFIKKFKPILEQRKMADKMSIDYQSPDDDEDESPIEKDKQRIFREAKPLTVFTPALLNEKEQTLYSRIQRGEVPDNGWKDSMIPILQERQREADYKVFNQWYKNKTVEVDFQPFILDDITAFTISELITHRFDCYPQDIKESTGRGSIMFSMYVTITIDSKDGEIVAGFGHYGYGNGIYPDKRKILKELKQYNYSQVQKISITFEIDKIA